MHRRKRAVVPALVLVLALALALAPTQPSGAQGSDTLPDKVIGFSLGPFAQRQETAAVEVDRMKGIGTNTVTVSVWWNLDNDRSVLAPTQYTKSDAEVRLAINAIRQRGLAAAILPVFTCANCRENWRGAADPSSKTVFYESYTNFIEKYAEIAEEEGANLVFIGSEMSSLQGDTEAWKDVARAARAKFSGALAYDVNWDAIDGVRFWDAVDIPSISAYFPLSNKRHPTLAALKKAWTRSELDGRNAAGEVEKLAARTGKKVLFGEAGYRSRDWATKLPFDYAADEGDPNPALQADAYQALIETFDSKPYWRGVLWWEWELNSARPEREETFTPRGKAAEDVIKAWYVDGVRPTAESPRLADRSGQTGGSDAPPSAGGGTEGRPGGVGARPGTVTPKPGTATTTSPSPDAPGGVPGVGGAAGPNVPADGEVAGAPTDENPASSSVPARTVAAVVAGALLLLVVLGAMSRRSA